MAETNSYTTIILDIDGVVLDSNFIKEKNVRDAALCYVDQDTANKFADYFTSLNGLPREKKIFNFFGNTQLANSVLEKYNFYNANSLTTAELTDGVFDFLSHITKSKKVYAVSGGDREELVNVLSQKKISEFFDIILGGPLTKEENLSEIQMEYPVLFIGDSKIDYECAEKIKADFVFMYGYTQFKEWEKFFLQKANSSIRIIKYISELL